MLLKIQNMMNINVELFQWLISFWTKTSGSGIKNENIPIKELAKKLNQPIIRNFNKRKVHLLL